MLRPLLLRAVYHIITSWWQIWLVHQAAIAKRKIKERKKIHDMASESEDTSDDDDIKHDTINIFSVRNEVFTTMDVVAPGKTGKTPIKLKIDTGASGNTLTLQTFRNLYGKRDPSKVITPVKNTKLTAYNGQKIPCYGSLDLELSHKGKAITCFLG